MRGASLEANVVGKGVYLVLSSRGDKPRQLAASSSTAARSAPPTPAPTSASGHVTVRRQRLYRLVQLPKTEQHRLTLRFAPGIAGYAFTFG